MLHLNLLGTLWALPSSHSSVPCEVETYRCQCPEQPCADVTCCMRESWQPFANKRPAGGSCRLRGLNAHTWGIQRQGGALHHSCASSRISNVSTCCVRHPSGSSSSGKTRTCPKRARAAPSSASRTWADTGGRVAKLDMQRVAWGSRHPCSAHVSRTLQWQESPRRVQSSGCVLYGVDQRGAAAAHLWQPPLVRYEHARVGVAEALRRRRQAGGGKPPFARSRRLRLRRAGCFDSLEAQGARLCNPH